MWREVLEEVDRNEDGRISYEEFGRGMEEILKRRHLYNVKSYKIK